MGVLQGKMFFTMFVLLLLGILSNVFFGGEKRRPQAEVLKSRFQRDRSLGMAGASSKTSYLRS